MRGANNLDIIHASFRSTRVLGTVANKSNCWINLLVTGFSRLQLFDGFPGKGYLNAFGPVVHLSEATGMFECGLELRFKR